MRRSFTLSARARVRHKPSAAYPTTSDPRPWGTPAPGKCTHAGESVECYHRTMPDANVHIAPCSMRMIAAAAAASLIASTRTLDARQYSFLHFSLHYNKYSPLRLIVGCRRAKTLYICSSTPIALPWIC